MDSPPAQKNPEHFSALIACHNGQWSVQAAAPDGTGGSMLKQAIANTFEDAIEKLRWFADDAGRVAARAKQRR